MANGNNERLDVAISPVHVYSPGLQMFSAPYEYNGQSISSILVGNYGKFAVWQAAVGAYALTPTPPADTIHLGVGYWGRFGTATGLVAVGAPATTANPFPISLNPLWNMIGDPYGVAIPFNSTNLLVVDTNGQEHTFVDASSPAVHLVSPILYTWQPGDSGYEQLYIGNRSKAEHHRSSHS